MTGLTEREMPTGKEFIVVEVPGARNKILIAFECRQIKNSIGDILPYDTDITTDASMEDHLSVFTVSLGKGNSVLPSKLLSDER